ncbi:YlbD family protein [Ectobacillus panaciterrae]|uniref:YlbD family protein n=1 Tax=Ectobacillus panaciterrae TaxID=363872 RepID=UPI00041C685B|nr:YlbD family protein [Ectobacillus panaciterrae]
MTMTKGQSHPSVQKFKEFVRNHPKMIQEVRSGAKTWQQFYEEWYLLGENDEIWNVYRTEGSDQTAVAAAQGNESGEQKNFVGQVMSLIKNINMDQVQYHLTNVTNTIGSVQQVIQQFQGNNTKQSQQPQQQNNPFFFQKD